MHIVSITTEIIRASGTGTVDATVIIEDQDGNRVEAATVSGVFSEDLSGADTGITNGSGEAVLTSDTFTSKPGVLGFCVDAVTHASFTYDPNSNADEDFACEGTGGGTAPIAAFSFSATLLEVTFTDASTDSDGTVVSWNWDFGDGNTSTEQNPMHTYAANGTYTVALTVTDDAGETGSTSQSVSVNDGTSSGTMHVESITTEVVRSGGSGNVEATFLIHDDLGSPVEGATVSGDFSGDLTGSDTGVTDASGIVVLVSDAITTRPDDLGICASAITHASLVYDPAANADPGFDCGTAAGPALAMKGLTQGLTNNEFQQIQEIPTEYAIGNYPNPFNPNTTIKIDLPEAGWVSVKVYNLLGQEVATLVDGHKTAGSYNVVFEAGRLSNGLYIYTLEAVGYKASKTMLLLK